MGFLIERSVFFNFKLGGMIVMHITITESTLKIGMINGLWNGVLSLGRSCNTTNCFPPQVISLYNEVTKCSQDKRFTVTRLVTADHLIFDWNPVSISVITIFGTRERRLCAKLPCHWAKCKTAFLCSTFTQGDAYMSLWVPASASPSRRCRSHLKGIDSDCREISRPSIGDIENINAT